MLFSFLSPFGDNSRGARIFAIRLTFSLSSAPQSVVCCNMSTCPIDLPLQHNLVRMKLAYVYPLATSRGSAEFQYLLKSTCYLIFRHFCRASRMHFLHRFVKCHKDLSISNFVIAAHLLTLRGLFLSFDPHFLPVANQYYLFSNFFLLLVHDAESGLISFVLKGV